MNKRELLGWVGVVLVLAAFFMVSNAIIDPDSLIYQLANLTGAIFLIGSSWDNRDWQPIALNVVWAAIALVGIYSIVF